jgi:hypothetical protein
VTVLVQPANDSLDPIATEAVSSCSDNAWNNILAPGDLALCSPVHRCREDRPCSGIEVEGGQRLSHGTAQP